jgi:16S rRNA processing protein RimM
VVLLCPKSPANKGFSGVCPLRDYHFAAAKAGRLIYVDRASAAKLPEGAEFICDLIGCVATDDSGRLIGTLTDVLQPGAGDVYVFRGPMGEVLVPALKSVFLEVDVRAKKMLLSAARLGEVAVFDE